MPGWSILDFVRSPITESVTTCGYGAGLGPYWLALKSWNKSLERSSDPDYLILVENSPLLDRAYVDEIEEHLRGAIRFFRAEGYDLWDRTVLILQERFAGRLQEAAGFVFSILAQCHLRPVPGRRDDSQFESTRPPGGHRGA